VGAVWVIVAADATGAKVTVAAKTSDMAHANAVALLFSSPALMQGNLVPIIKVD
jgi:hypothetical protein